MLVGETVCVAAGELVSVRVAVAAGARVLGLWGAGGPRRLREATLPPDQRPDGVLSRRGHGRVVRVPGGLHQQRRGPLALPEARTAHPRRARGRGARRAERGLERRAQCLGAGRSVPQSAREEMRRRVPPVYAPYTDMVVGDDGTVLIRLRSDAAAPQQFMVVDARGNVAGQLTLPASTAPLAVSATHIWGVERDSLDVPSVVRLRFVR